MLLLLNPIHTWGQSSILDRQISLPRQSTTLYNALNLISQKENIYFVYDSQLVNSDKKVKVEANRVSLKAMLDNLLADPELEYKVIGQHILIYKKKTEYQRKESPTPSVLSIDTVKPIVLRGHVLDKENKSPLAYAAVYIESKNTGIVSNADGYFELKIPKTFESANLLVSHLGYQSRKIPVELMNSLTVDVYLERRVISIQEVIIRYIDPAGIVQKAIQKIKDNYAVEPFYTTTFYREGVMKNGKFLNYSEAVFKVYNSGVNRNEYADQVKLLKSRKVQNIHQEDTINLKLKAGVLSGLQLDIAKNTPDFLDPTQTSLYTYSYSDILSYNSQDVYAISFVQKKNVVDALFKGTLYIDKESYAILGADFEINPDYISMATNDLVLKKSRKVIVKLDKINYSVSYFEYNGHYYLSHTRGEITLRTRFRNHLSYNKFNTFLELATCQVDTLNVKKFAREEIISPEIVFSEVPFTFDKNFWGDYNIIFPEEKLNEALTRIKSKIEETKNNP